MVFPSVYDMTNASMTTVRKQHFWEYFSGKAISTRRWRENDIAGSCTRGITDASDFGYKLIAPATGYARGTIDFDQTATDVGKVRQFNSDGSVSIFVTSHTKGGSTGARVVCGLITGTDYYGNGTSRSAVVTTDTTTKYMHSNGSAGANETDLTITPDGAFHSYKIVNTGTTNSCSVDGVLSGNGYVATSTNVPTSSKMQPNFEVYVGNAGSAGTAQGNIKYFEAYNT